MNLSHGIDQLASDIVHGSRAKLDSEFDRIIAVRSELLKELFEAGIRSNLGLDQTAPMHLRVEQLRGDLESLAYDLKAMLPTLPRKYRRTHGRLKVLANQCNSLAWRYLRRDRGLESDRPDKRGP